MRKPSDKMSLKRPSSLNAYVTLVRIPNCIMIGLGVVVGEAIAAGGIPPLFKSLAGFLTASLMMGGTMVLNDIHDMDVDRVNSSQRPLPSGIIGVTQAKGYAIILTALSIVFAAILGPWTTLTALLALALMFYYNTRGKRTGLLGNAVVSFNVALPFFYGGVAVGSLRPLLFTFSILAFLANLGREVAKGIPDLEGDRVLGVRTLAVSHGPKLAATIASGLFILASLLSFVPLAFGKLSLLYFPGVVIADLGFISTAYRLLRNQNPDGVRRVKNQVLVWMFFGLIGFLLGGTVYF